MITIENVKSKIEDLKEQKPKMKNSLFKNRWEEIFIITTANNALKRQ